jgi:integrase
MAHIQDTWTRKDANGKSRRTGRWGHGTRWQARYRGPDGRERSQRFVTKVEAERWITTSAADVAREEWIDPSAGSVLFSTYAETWLAGRPDLRPRSRMLYRTLLDNHLLPTFGHTLLKRVTPAQVRTWYAILVARTPGSAASAYRLLRAIFSTAVNDELLVRSPCRVKRGGSDRAVERPMMTLAEVEALGNAMPPRMRAAVLLAAWGGLRRGEVLGLRRRHVDPLRSRLRVEEAQLELEDGTILFDTPKTDAGVRTVHLPKVVMDELSEHLAAYVAPGPDALLFTGRGAVPMRPRTLATAFRTARASVGLPQAHFHDLRHFHLTMAAATGATTKELMRRAGHSSPIAALRYQHATEDRDRAIADALSGLAQTADVVELPRTNRGHGA